MRRYTQLLDCHIHIERGEYTLDWINEFVKVAVKRGLNEIWLLEHCYRFREFLPMYDSVCIYSDNINKWFHSKAVFDIIDYLRLIDSVRSQKWPVNIKFGLEVCYFKQFENLVYSETKDKDLDFLVGSVHFIDDFAYDHNPEHRVSVNVDNAYRRYFETSIDLAESRLYSGIAHPDCIKLFGHKPSFALNDYYDRLAAVLAKNNMYVEQNSGSFRRCPDTSELGMDAGLIKSIKKHGVKIKTASDAHSPEDVGLYIKELEAQL
jgi:histidinol-phosphatase (PHP family)